MAKLRKLFSLALLAGFFAASRAEAAAPGIEWQRSLGGSADNAAYSIQQTSDGSYIAAGTSESTQRRRDSE